MFSVNAEWLFVFRELKVELKKSLPELLSSEEFVVVWDPVREDFRFTVEVNKPIYRFPFYLMCTVNAFKEPLLSAWKTWVTDNPNGSAFHQQAATFFARLIEFLNSYLEEEPYSLKVVDSLFSNKSGLPDIYLETSPSNKLSGESRIGQVRKVEITTSGFEALVKVDLESFYFKDVSINEIGEYIRTQLVNSLCKICNVLGIIFGVTDRCVYISKDVAEMLKDELILWMQLSRIGEEE